MKKLFILLALLIPSLLAAQTVVAGPPRDLSGNILGPVHVSSGGSFISDSNSTVNLTNGTITYGTISANISGAILTGNLALGGETLTGNGTINGTVTVSGAGAVVFSNTTAAADSPVMAQFINPTAANSSVTGTYSPSLNFAAQCWNGTASNPVQWFAYAVGEELGGLSASNLTIAYKNGTGAISRLMTFNSYTSAVTLLGQIQSDSGGWYITVGGTATFSGVVNANAGIAIAANQTLVIPTGTTSGNATLVGGHVFVSTAAFTTNSSVILTNLINGGTVTGQAWLSNQTVGTGFNITSTSLDTSTYRWTILHDH